MTIDKELILTTALKLHDEGKINLDDRSDDNMVEILGMIGDSFHNDKFFYGLYAYAALHEATQGGITLPNVNLDDYYVVECAYKIDRRKKSNPFEFKRGDYVDYGDKHVDFIKIWKRYGFWPRCNQSKIEEFGSLDEYNKYLTYKKIEGSVTGSFNGKDDWFKAVVIPKSAISIIENLKIFDSTRLVSLREAFKIVGNNSFTDDTFVACKEPIEVVGGTIPAVRLVYKKVM